MVFYGKKEVSFREEGRTILLLKVLERGKSEEYNV